MNRIFSSVLILCVTPLAAVAQGGTAETEVRAFIVAYDSAVSARDVAYLERVLPADYVLTGASGRQFSRDQVLAYHAQERTRPSYRRLSLRHDNLEIHAMATMAIVTNDYTSETAPLEGPAVNSETTRGRHTGVFVKRAGHWMVLAEQDTELPHDGAEIERQVRSRGQEYFALFKRLADGRSYHDLVASGDLAAFGDLHLDSFACYCDTRGHTGKSQELDQYRSSTFKLDSLMILEQTVVPIDNNSAVEQGAVRYFGSQGAQPVDGVTRYTKTWVSWSQGWQLIAAHLSSAGQ